MYYVAYESTLQMGMMEPPRANTPNWSIVTSTLACVPVPTMRYLVNTLYQVSPFGSHTLILFDIKLYYIRSRALLKDRLYNEVKADHELV